MSKIRLSVYMKESHAEDICPSVNKKAINVYTDHSKTHIDECGDIFIIDFNSCGLCGENKTVSQRLMELEKKLRRERND